MEIVQAVKKLNPISRERLNFRRRPILCRTLYRNPIQACNFGGTFDQLFLWIVLCNFHTRCPSTLSIPWCKKVKNDQKLKSRGGGPALRGAWRDCDTNDIFAHCSLIFYFLDFKFFNFVCLSELHSLIWLFFKNSFRKMKNIRRTTQNALAPSIFIVLFNACKIPSPNDSVSLYHFILMMAFSQCRKNFTIITTRRRSSGG